MRNVLLALTFIFAVFGAVAPGQAQACTEADHAPLPMCVVRGVIIAGLTDPSKASHWARNHCGYPVVIQWVIAGGEHRMNELQPKDFKEELVPKSASVKLACCSDQGQCK